jgi:predicted lipoprotein with Yx(FWY)xxD motif
MRSGRIRWLLVVALCSLVMAACSDGEEPGDVTPTPSEESESETPEPTEQPTDATVAVEDSDLGEIVVDAEGRTLYVFLVDEGSDSTCYDDCEASWPPLTVDGDPAAGEGIDASLLGTSEREDGSVQVTLDGHPLYYFAADETPDDMNGQGVGDVWYAVSPEGEAIDQD